MGILERRGEICQTAASTRGDRPIERIANHADGDEARAATARLAERRR